MHEHVRGLSSGSRHCSIVSMAGFSKFLIPEVRCISSFSQGGHQRAVEAFCNTITRGVVGRSKDMLSAKALEHGIECSTGILRAIISQQATRGTKVEYPSVDKGAFN